VHDMDTEWVILAKYLEILSNSLSSYGLPFVSLMNLMTVTQTYFVWPQVTDQHMSLY
jgi:hypothetical protein